MTKNNIEREFRAYQHIVAHGFDAVKGIENGTCYIFPKIDGANGSIWLDKNGNLQVAKRTKLININCDHAGFCQWANQQSNIIEYLKKHPTHRLFGEWLVPHSLRTYRAEAWKKFYVFDVVVDNDETEDYIYLSYKEYKPFLEEYNISYVPAIAIAINPTFETLINLLKKNTFLIKDGMGIGEGIVVKNYSFVNKYGKTVWSKLVTSNFKDEHIKAMGPHIYIPKMTVEERIAEKYVTEDICSKIIAKIKVEKGSFENKDIYRFLYTVYHDIVEEEIWDIVKFYKNPTIDFYKLKRLITVKAKKYINIEEKHEASHDSRI